MNYLLSWIVLIPLISSVFVGLAYLYSITQKPLSKTWFTIPALSAPFVSFGIGLYFFLSWLTQPLEPLALQLALQKLVPEHFAEVKTRRERQADKTLTAVHERLVKEINYWQDRYLKLSDDVKSRETASHAARKCSPSS